MACSASIGASDWLAFLGSVLGVVGGIIAAFLAVHLQRRVQTKDTERTLTGLLDELEIAAGQLKVECGTRPAEAVRRVHRAFTALRDTALAVRTSSFEVASLAARLEHTTVWPEIERLRAANGGVALPDGVARAGELADLCYDLRVTLSRK